jgi:hypothetical protein
LFEVIGSKLYRWPGGALPDDVPFQFVEKEYLRAEEYDRFLRAPADFSVRLLWPCMATGLQGLAELPPIYSIGIDTAWFGHYRFQKPISSAWEALWKLGEYALASIKAFDAI